MRDDCQLASLEFAMAAELVELEDLRFPPERDPRTLSYRIIVAAHERFPLAVLDAMLKV